MRIHSSIIGLLIIGWIMLVTGCSPGGAEFTRGGLGPVAAPELAVATATPMATATPADTSAGNTAAGGGALAANQNCMICHALHPESIVLMPHDPNPSCNACHNGSPLKIGCPSCHSMHQIDMEHPSDPNLACESCHTDVVPATPDSMRE